MSDPEEVEKYTRGSMIGIHLYDYIKTVTVEPLEQDHPEVIAYIKTMKKPRWRMGK